jgi:hypothetical protein
VQNYSWIQRLMRRNFILALAERSKSEFA